MSKFLNDFEKAILNLIDAGELNSSLNLIINFVSKLAYGQANSMTVANVFGSSTLDRLCQSIGAKSLGEQKDFINGQISLDNQLVAYIATELYNIGGHTAVIEDFIKARPEKKHLILITDTFNSINHSLVEDRFQHLNVKIIFAPKSTSIEKLKWLQNILMADAPSQVFLLNHPQDAVSVAAVQQNLTPNLNFYHHAGHLICLGIYLSYAKHIDFQPGSFYNCCNNLGINNNIYLPLVTDDISVRPLSSFSLNSKLRTCSSGSYVKFKNHNYLYSYIEEVPKIISITGGVHVHIGNLPSYALDNINKGLQELEISLDRFVYIPWVKSIATAMHQQKIDIYIDSFPWGGGRTVVEVMASGTPIVVHNNYKSRQLCTTDITYPEAFRWHKIDELYSYLSTITTEKLQLESAQSRKHYETHHHPQILRRILIKLEHKEETAHPSELKYYRTDDLQSFFDQLFAIKEHQIALEDIATLEISNQKCDNQKKSNYQSKIKQNTNFDIESFNLARREMTQHLLRLSREQLETEYNSDLGKNYHQLLNNVIRYEPITEEDKIFIAEILKSIATEVDKSLSIQNLLIAMLYCRADQLPLQVNTITSTSQWFFEDYLKYIMDTPLFFKQKEEAEKYYYFLKDLVDYFHDNIVIDNNKSALWQKIVVHFVRIANFIPVYFNEANLKDIYIKRAEILELFLKNNGYQIDYEFPARPVNRKKIRLGVLAAHFTPGSETFAYLPVYEYLSRDFEVILYSLKHTGRPLEGYCRSCANNFKLLPQNLSEQVKTIRADDLDILFIATNVTAVTNQICLLATHRLARIQATSGGSVVTTGMRHMDYYISGTLTDPSPTAHEQYREKLVKLEGTAHCFSYGCEEEKATAEVDRENLGISEEAVIFISGANFFKVVPELIHTWAKIIAEVPNSVLVLLPFGPNWSNSYPKQAFEKHLNNIFSQYDVSAERLLVLDPQPVPNREDVKEYFKIADIYLDSYPFSGTTSLVEPLQVNLPVISRQGNTFRSAMGAAMVRSLDISDLVADSEESYIQLAVELGTNPDLRKQKSDRIKQKMQQNPSFLDSRSYSAQMGALFQQLFQEYQAKNLIDQLGLRDINIVMFPDWQQSEESLYEDFANILKTMSSNPDKNRMTLLIDTDGIDGEDANWLFSSVAMNLLMEEAVDIADELEVSLLDDLTENEWELLLSLLQGRISLDNENQNAIAKAKAESLTIYS